jgi:hypothetical protein
VYYSTLEGEQAYALEGKVSQFTEALLRALASSADNDQPDDKWRVDTSTLSRGINFLLARAARKTKGKLAQANKSDDSYVFTLHELAHDPKVPVVVECDPEEANREAELSYSNGVVTSPACRGDEWGWDVYLTPGDYTFVASTPNPPERRGQKQKEIRPPHREVKVELRP